MSEATPTTAPVVEPVAAETVVAPAATEAPAAVEPVVEAPAATEEAAATTEAAPATEEATEAVAEKTVEPITEGQLAYKGPGLVKSLIPSKKEFWLSDAAVEPENLSLFLRGEKPEVAHPVVAWASQTGKGLLFFNKKSETDRLHPADVLPLYDATDLKKEAQHQFAFKIGTHTHTFKATTDAERDGWYLSIEKAIELSKASKEEIQSSEGYKAELEKLTKPAAPVVAAAAAGEKKKSRSTSRGLLNRLKNTKEETEEKKEEAKAEEKAEAPAAAAVEPEAAGAGEIAPAVVAVPAETAEETPAAAEAATETPATEAKAEEKPKVSKRQSIFGKFSLKSPTKEKEQKDAELGAAPVSENPPVLPETATTEAAATEPAAAVVGEPVVTDEAAAEAPKDVPAAETVSPTKEKSNFLSSFIKRSRSVSPSTALKEETPIAATTETPAAASAATEEAPVVAAAEPVAATETPAASTEAAATEEARPEPTKRQSVLGSLGRRASKAFKGINQKKEPTSPTAATAEEAAEEGTPAAATEEVKAAEKEEAPAAIADVVPEAVSVGEAPKTTPVVAASA